ncbi:MAG: 2OG-Fe(II) oxygenase [Nitrospirae bacterium]|nr:MAG: 2OG-Fe(II) oxygenase [Nitrospirota bacterium]
MAPATEAAPTADPAAAALAAVERQAARAAYLRDGRLLFLERFLPEAALRPLQEEAQRLKPRLHRNYIPRHKKGGAVGYPTLRAEAPAILALYRSAALLDFVAAVTGEAVQHCPEDDPHACALYYYTEPGDHIGFHYDTSYYRGLRFTLLVGLADRSSSRLVCRLHTRDPAPEEEVALATPPGCLVLFDGDALYHAVTPLGPGEERIMLTLQYVTDPRMGLAHRFVSNMKDAIAYFGLPALRRRRP